MGIALNIIQGNLDSELQQIFDAVVERRKLLKRVNAVENLFQFEVGQTVRFLQIRPAYMIGETGMIVEKNRTKFVIQLDNTVGRFSGRITVPANCVEPA